MGDQGFTSWSVDDVEKWLHSIQMGHRVELFRSKNISGLLLSDIREELLEEIGVESSWDRYSILKHLSELVQHRKGVGVSETLNTTDTHESNESKYEE